MGEVNSRLVGGPYPGLELFIPINTSCWAMNRPVDPLCVVASEDPLPAPVGHALYYEKGKTLNGLRRFVIEGRRSE